MISAKNNVIVKLRDSHDFAIFNPLSGSFDVMDEDERLLLEKIASGVAIDPEFSDCLLERGYVYRSAKDEQSAIAEANEAFLEETADSQVQLMLIPTYGCNLACVYCYEHGVAAEHKVITKEAVDAFFDYARKNFSGYKIKPYITLFGGEPLVNSPAQRAIIDYIVERCAEEGYELAAVTNGYDFTDFVNILKKARIKEMQFTLDGCRDAHDQRRATANGKGTFDRVIAGIGAAVEAGFPVNLRAVVDRENIEDLVNLAEYLDSKGWLDLPPTRFKTQIGRNYELFSCYSKPQYLMSQVELWAEYAKLSKLYPILAKFHRPDFYAIRHLVETGELPIASFDTCPACKTEWVFDLNGEIYGCTASCGRKEYLLGTYYPEVRLNQERISRWQSRSVQTIDKCRDCKYDVICGGGCGVVAANKNNCDPLSPDCRPIQELSEIGINYYINEIRAMTETPDGAPEPATQKGACFCNSAESLTGCVVCGGELAYSEQPSQEKCLVCGQTFETNVKCKNGHYVCDDCHRADILTKVERYLNDTAEQDPVALAKKIFDLPGLKMHGPEYHSIVPAILVTAYQNKNQIHDPAAVKEAIRRGKEIAGGSCGYSGGCGAALGTGIAASIIEKATPMSTAPRGNALKASGQALLAISRHGGPRCCKRDAVTSMETFIQNSDYFHDVSISSYVCKQFMNNKDCLGINCPYFPRVEKGERRIKNER